MEARHLISSHFRYLEHLGKLFTIAVEEVKERQAIKVLCLLIANLNSLCERMSVQKIRVRLLGLFQAYLLIALTKSLLR